MNGQTYVPPTNGVSHEPQRDTVDLSQVLAALEAIYTPQSTNDIRQAASAYLENAKKLPQAPAHGFTLSSDKSRSPALRHYGLSMLEYAIKYNWEDYTEEHAGTLRNYVTQLAQDVSEQEPLFLRNKVAQLWIEIAKRSWAAEWMDMDEQLVRLWSTSMVHQVLVLYILETLSEDIFAREDPIAALRGNVLGQACVDIFTPAAVLSEYFPNRDTNSNVRFGDEGWVKRLCDLLDWCLNNDLDKDRRFHLHAVKTLGVLRAAMSWLMPKTVSVTHCVDYVCKALSVNDIPMQTVISSTANPPVTAILTSQAAVEVLLAICSRSNLQDSDFAEVVCLMYTSERIALIRAVYTGSSIDANDIDDAKYALCKKTSEASTAVNLLRQVADDCSCWQILHTCSSRDYNTPRKMLPSKNSLCCYLTS